MSTVRWSWWDLVYVVAIGALVGFALISTVRSDGARIGGVVAVLAIGVAYVLLGRRDLTAGIDAPRVNPLPFAIVLVLWCGLCAYFVPSLASAQSLAIPSMWWLLSAKRASILGTFAIGAAVTVGFTAGSGWTSAALWQSLSFEALSMVFSIALGLWIGGIGAWGDERARLLTELQGTQGALEVANRDAGATAERERMARDLHDTIAQSLTSLVLLAQRGRAELQGDPGRAEQTVELLETTAREALEEARALVATTAPVALGEGGLAEVLRRLGTRFERETGVRVRVHVLADAPREVQVVLLRAAQEGLANVRKHSAAGAVTIAVDDDDGAIALTVDDDGRGPIGYVDDTECGFGILGMRERVALVGGTVDLGFRDGGGARLRVRVPLEPPGGGDDVSIRILVADDHPIVRSGIAGLLAATADFEVVGEAADGAEAVRLAGETLPDIVLMDLRMPVLDGEGATARILAEHPAVKVLVLTTYESDDHILGAIEAGASGYLLKAAPQDEIVAGIRAVIAGETVLAPAIAAMLVRAVRTRPPELSARELEVLRLVAAGRSNQQIATELFIGTATVKTHLVHAFDKLGVNDRTRAVTLAMELKLL